MALSKEERNRKRRQDYHKDSPERRARRNELARKHYHQNLEKYRAVKKDAWKKLSEEQKEAHHAARQRRARADPKKYLLNHARKRAKRRGIEFTITEADFEIPEYCPIFEFKLLPVLSKWEDRFRVPSLDRIDNSRGYVPGNVRVLSLLANDYKGDLSLESIKRLYKYSIGEI